MNRRDALFSTSALSLATLGIAACSATPVHAQHAHHHGDDDLVEATAGCVAKGQACVAHCLMLLASGDTAMADCASATAVMLAVMQGLMAAAAAGNKHLAELARVAAKFCQDCEIECRKHQDKHPTCKACAEACARTLAACKKYAA